MKNLEFDPHAFEDLAWWVEKDRKIALKIIKLIQAIQQPGEHVIVRNIPRLAMERSGIAGQS